jgi:hypothetical protein
MGWNRQVVKTMNKGRNILDCLARTRIRVGGHRLPAFQFCGYTGVLAAIALAMTLVGKTGLSLWVMGLIIAAAMATFLVLVYATKIITGEEQIIYYHHEIAVMLVTALVVNVLHRPLLPYLDITILGIGAFLACGRVGCVMVGCCHGRPFPWGIRYRDEHAREGFAPYLVGIRLFPIQAAESLWVLFVTVRGALLVVAGRPPGTALAWYTFAYGVARFSFEFIRGDTERPYTWGFSQGQWLSLWLMLAVIAAELTGRMAFTPWHVAAVLGVVAMMLGATLHRKLDRTQRFQLLHPHHVSEIAEALRLLNAEKTQSRSVAVASTSMGVQISAEQIRAKEVTHQYAFSRKASRMEHKSAATLADLVMQLRHRMGSARLLAGDQGVFHLLVREATKREPVLQ